MSFNTCGPEMTVNNGTPHQNLHCVLRVLIVFFMVAAGSVQAGQLSKAAAERTREHLEKIKNITPAEIQSFNNRINNLDYTSSRAIRALMQLPDISTTDLTTIFTLPELKGISYSAVPLLEYYVQLPGATLIGAQELLHELQGVSFVIDQVLTALPSMKKATAGDSMRIIRRIKMLDETDEAGLWATRALFSVKGITSDEVLDIMDRIPSLSPAQKRVAEKYFAVKTLVPSAITVLLPQLATLPETEATNLNGFLAANDTKEERVQHWLDIYFSLPTATREAIYPSLSPSDKNQLLRGLGEAAPTIAERLNNLHGISDNLGQEIGSARLARMSAGGFWQLFSRLDPVTRGHYTYSMQRALETGNRSQVVALLTRATAAARRQLARDLTMENMYVLLAHGSELFDSSFRDILVPQMIEKIRLRYHGNLLTFLVAIDPDALFVSDFLTHLAWKGCLTIFFPKEAEHQQEILSILARSALGNEESLLFFAATFTELLQTLQPQARTTLLDMLQLVAQKKGTRFARQVRVILQEYLDHHPQLLSNENRKTISAMLDHQGRIDLSPYLATPFAEWLVDGRLSSLSVFQQDDDGAASYHANGIYLLQHGYQPTLSEEYTPGPGDAKHLAEISHLLVRIHYSGAHNLNNLFRLAAKTPVVVRWVKQIGGVELNHFVYVYQGKSAQERLLKTFLNKGHELFAQRGHSYWRGQQLLQPLERLIERHEIPPELLTDRPRFISIGSCGGIRVFRELTSIFGDRLDLLATVGTGTSTINTPYNTRLLEIIAEHQNQQPPLTWQDIARRTDNIFTTAAGGEYIRPGSLPAILYKMSAR